MGLFMPLEVVNVSNSVVPIRNWAARGVFGEIQKSTSRKLKQSPVEETEQQIMSFIWVSRERPTDGMPEAT